MFLFNFSNTVLFSYFQPSGCIPPTLVEQPMHMFNEHRNSFAESQPEKRNYLPQNSNNNSNTNNNSNGPSLACRNNYGNCDISKDRLSHSSFEDSNQQMQQLQIQLQLQQPQNVDVSVWLITFVLIT